MLFAGIGCNWSGCRTSKHSKLKYLVSINFYLLTFLGFKEKQVKNTIILAIKKIGESGDNKRKNSINAILRSHGLFHLILLLHSGHNEIFFSISFLHQGQVIKSHPLIL